MAECILGVRGKDFVIVAADGVAARSVIMFKNNEDKIMKLDNSKLLAAIGDNGDRNAFTQLIEKNVHLYALKNDIALSTHAAANFTRNQLATALRKKPYQVNVVMAGVDEKVGSSMYYMDYLGSMANVDVAAHGYGSHYAYAVLDRNWREDITLEEGVKIIKTCIAQLDKRFSLKQPMFYCRAVTTDGIQEIDLSAAPEE
jgi:20S proteasome subunit beta 4